MSRQVIREALALARKGDLAGALALLRTLDVAAARAGLTKAIAKNEAVARTLWNELWPDDRQEEIASELPPQETSPTVLDLPRRMVLVNPGPPLTMIGNPAYRTIRFRESFVAEAWALTGIAARGRPSSREACSVDLESDSNGARFARGLGLDNIAAGEEQLDWGESGRTVKLHRLKAMSEIEPLADRISRLIAPVEAVTQATLYYVIVELLRNAVQHSEDPLGGVVAAQAMTSAQDYDRPTVQVAVADNGIGILEHLRRQHRELIDPGAALEKAMRAHISGTFAEGLSGSLYNAGLGLFTISELTKLTGGRLLVASRGAALSIQGSGTDATSHTSSLVTPKGTGYPGTLVAFEIPLGDTHDFGFLMEEVRKREKQQTPARAIHRWITYDAAPPDANRILVSVVRENTEKAAAIAKSVRISLLAGDTIMLDFSGVSFVTQSFLHALLFKPLRIAWAEGLPVHVVNATPAVRSALEMLEEYALGG